MREDEVIRPTPYETLRCIRSAQQGGPFVFELELAPGGKGPPRHYHEDQEEIVEMLEGEIVFRVGSYERRLGPGGRLVLRPGEVHTFYNPSRTTPARARVTAGPSFERFIAQPSLTAKLMYLVYVDPAASRMVNPLVRAAARVIALAGKLRGVRLRDVPDASLQRVKAS